MLSLTCITWRVWWEFGGMAATESGVQSQTFWKNEHFRVASDSVLILRRLATGRVLRDYFDTFGNKMLIYCVFASVYQPDCSSNPWRWPALLGVYVLQHWLPTAARREMYWTLWIQCYREEKEKVEWEPVGLLGLISLGGWSETHTPLVHAVWH